jgi:acyl carrier protein
MNVDSPEAHVRQLLRDWVTSKARRPVNGDLRDDTPILEQRVITSLQVMELILFVEKTCGRAVDLAQLRPSSFRSIEDIYQTFFAGANHGKPAIQGN